MVDVVAVDVEVVDVKVVEDDVEPKHLPLPNSSTLIGRAQSRDHKYSIPIGGQSSNPDSKSCPG